MNAKIQLLILQTDAEHQILEVHFFILQRSIIQCETYFFGGCKTTSITTEAPIQDDESQKQDIKRKARGLHTADTNAHNVARFQRPRDCTTAAVYLYFPTRNSCLSYRTWSTLRALDVKVLPLLLTAVFPPAAEPPSRLFCPPPPTAAPPLCSSSFGCSEIHAHLPPRLIPCCMFCDT